MSDTRVTDALAHARRLLRPAVDTEADTEQYETHQDEPGTQWVAAAGNAPTVPAMEGGPTDHSLGQHASKVTGTLDVLISAIGVLDHRVEGLQNAVTARSVALEHAQAEHRDLRDRHERLTETVQNHGGRLDELDQAIVEVGYQRFAIRLVLVLVGLMTPLVLLILAAVAVLVVR